MKKMYMTLFVVSIALLPVVLIFGQINDEIENYLINKCEDSGGVRINSSWGECRKGGLRIIQSGELVITKLEN